MPPRLPDFAGLLAYHRLALFAVEGLRELHHVRKRSIAAESWQRMRVGVRPQPRIFDTFVGAPDLPPAKEEALLCSEAALVSRPRLALKRFFVSGIGAAQPA